MLVDTSVWIGHFRIRIPELLGRLAASEVWCHPYVIGELACGALHPRAQTLADLALLPRAPVASHEEVLAFLDAHDLAGEGLGWVDVHLLASARLAHVRLWSLDKALADAARALRMSVED